MSTTAVTLIGLVPQAGPTPAPVAQAPSTSPPLSVDRYVPSQPASPSLENALVFGTVSAGAAEGGAGFGLAEGAAAFGGSPAWAVGAGLAGLGAGAAAIRSAHQWQAGSDEYHRLKAEAARGPLSGAQQQRLSSLEATYDRRPTPMAGTAPQAPSLTATPIHRETAPNHTGHTSRDVRDLRDAVSTTPAGGEAKPSHTGHPASDRTLEALTRPAGKPLEHEHPSDLLTPKTDYVRGSAYPDRSPDLNARDAGGPGTWVHNPGRTAPERAAAYQEQITKAPWGNEYAIGDTHFDGVKTENGRRVLLEAKGPGKGDKIDAKGEPKPWYGGFAADVKQLDRQGDVARRHGLDLEVHVAEKPYADALREALPGRSNVQIIYTPPR